MSVKDKYVTVRYHMNTGKAHFIVKESAKASSDKVRIPRAFLWFKLVRMAKGKYYLSKDVWDVDYKAKYRMEC